MLPTPGFRWLALLGLLLPAVVLAAESQPTEGLARAGADTCLGCHNS